MNYFSSSRLSSFNIVSLLFSVFATRLWKSLVAGSYLVTDEQSFSSDHMHSDFMEGIALKGKAFSSLISAHLYARMSAPTKRWILQAKNQGKERMSQQNICYLMQEKSIFV